MNHAKSLVITFYLVYLFPSVAIFIPLCVLLIWVSSKYELHSPTSRKQSMNDFLILWKCYFLLNSVWTISHQLTVLLEDKRTAIVGHNWQGYICFVASFTSDFTWIVLNFFLKIMSCNIISYGYSDSNLSKKTMVYLEFISTIISLCCIH